MEAPTRTTVPVSTMECLLENLQDMLAARGEDVTEIMENGAVVDQERYQRELIEWSTDKTVILFALSKEVVKDVYAQIKRHDDAASMQAQWGATNFLLIFSQEAAPSSTVMNTLEDREKKVLASGGMFQIFYKHELLYNPSKHVLVPKHEKLSDEEAREVMERYMVKSRSQLPVILKTDMMARWLGLRHGDMVRITRHNDTSGTHYYYRCCL